MKLKNIILRSLVVLSLLAGLVSCSKWLAVDMEDSIMEDKLFSTNEGFLTALNGVYSTMNVNYSSVMMMGALDVMAQYYNVAKNSNHAFNAYATFKFDQFKSVSNSLWTSQYAMIANLNTILDHYEKDNSVIVEAYAPYIKGEALALRAFLHFDLLRLYGPIYSEATSSEVCLPYQATVSKDIQPLITAAQFIDNVIKDLEAASTLLEKDRIREEGVLNGASEDLNEGTALRYRQYRMNYYAVRSLLARAYLWKGDKAKAYEIATDVILENFEKSTFPWVKPADVTSATAPDLIFSSEVIFSTYNTSRTKLFDSMFKNTVKTNGILTFKGSTKADGDFFSKLTYVYDDFNDFRRSYQWDEKEVDITNADGAVTGTETILTFMKFQDVSNEKNRYMIPLVRLSELYLIAAECAPTPTEAISALNTIRAARNCTRLDETLEQAEIDKQITLEYMREMIGEGQLFFHYKRLAKTSILSGTDFGQEESWYGPAGLAEGSFEMSLSNYVWPMPEVEANKRITK